jgi:HEAT repeat protein
MKTDEVLDALMLVVKHPERKEQLRPYLMEHGDAVVERIKEMTRNSGLGLRLRGYHLMGTLGVMETLWLLEDGTVESTLIQALKDSEPEARQRATWSLLLIEEAKKTGANVAYLIDVLHNDSAPNNRAEAALALAFVKWDARVVDALIESLSDNESVHFESMFGTSAGDTVGAYATHALAKLRDKRGIAAMTPKALEPHWTVQGTAEVFEYVGEPAVEYLIQGLNMEKWESRERAAASLGAIRDARSCQPLIYALRDEHWKVRRRAAEALGRIRDPNAVGPLAEAFNDESRDVRDSAFAAIVEIGKPAVQILANTLRHPNDRVRERTVRALGAIGDVEALTSLVDTMNDQSRGVRGAAKDAVKRIRRKR